MFGMIELPRGPTPNPTARASGFRDLVRQPGCGCAGCEVRSRSFGARGLAGTYVAGVTAAARRCTIVAVNTAAVAAVAASSRNPTS
jgi:hypothetical protein